MIHLLWIPLLPLIMYYGFEWYAGVTQSWERKSKYLRWLDLPPIAIFGTIDVIFNILFGSILYKEWPFVHGITFSQRTQYWADQGSSMGLWWKTQLNKILPGHIS